MRDTQRLTLDLAYLNEVGPQALERAMRLYRDFGRGMLVFDMRRIGGRRRGPAYLSAADLQTGGWPPDWLDMVSSYAPDTQCVVMLVRPGGVFVYQLDAIAQTA